MAAALNLQHHKAKILLLACLSLTVGVALASFLPVYLDNRVFFILAWLCLLPVLWLWPRRLSALGLLGAAFFLGIWRYQLTTNITAGDLEFYRNKDIVLTGRVKAEPSASDSSWQLTVAAENVKGNFLLYAPLSSSYKYGDEVQADCFLQPPRATPDFDASRYWRRFGVAGTCQTANIKLIASGRGNWFYQQIINLRQGAGKLIKAGLPYPEADLGGAMTLGVGNKLSADLKMAFSQSGLTHIVAISGLNVSLLVGLLFNGALALGLARRPSLWLSLAGVTMFVVLVGAPASAVRAGIMGVLYLLAAFWGRLNKLINALALAAAVSLLANPLLLRDDIGWQLSFLALLGIIYIYPFFRLILKNKWRPLDLVLDGFSLTLAAQLATWPILAISFKQVSLIAPISNVLAVWTTPFIIVAMFGALLVSLIYHWWLWWLPVLLFLKYLISVAVLSAKLPLAVLQINKMNPLILVIYYIVIGAVIYWRWDLVKKNKN